MTRVGLNVGAGEQLVPVQGRGRQRFCARYRLVTPRHRARARGVSLEVIGVDLHAADGSRSAEPDDRPVVTRTAAAASLPSVSHVCGPTGQDEVLPMPKEHVTTYDHPPAILQGGKIDI